MSSRSQILAATALAAAVAVTASGPTAAGQALHHAAATPTTDAAVELLECSRGRAKADRWALFRGEMQALASDGRMRMRFRLEERVGRGAWRLISAPGLGVWHESRPGVARFAYRQRIAGLQKGASYRVRVGFEWLDAAGAVVVHEREFSRACRQPGRLPNLTVKGVPVAAPGPTADTVRYSVTIANNGRAAARGVEVRLTVDGAEVDTQPVGLVRSGERRTVGFVGPACATTVGVRADPRGVVREVSEHDNELLVTCPPVG
jgi:CARDB